MTQVVENVNNHASSLLKVRGLVILIRRQPAREITDVDQVQL
jgi:hypothetical protein